MFVYYSRIGFLPRQVDYQLKMGLDTDAKSEYKLQIIV
jgi:hypothetical protein